MKAWLIRLVLRLVFEVGFFLGMCLGTTLLFLWPMRRGNRRDWHRERV